MTPFVYANKTGPQCPQPFLAFCCSPSPYGVSWQIAIQHRIVELPEESMCHRILQAFWSSLGKHLQTEAIQKGPLGPNQGIKRPNVF